MDFPWIYGKIKLFPIDSSNPMVLQIQKYIKFSIRQTILVEQDEEPTEQDLEQEEKFSKLYLDHDGDWILKETTNQTTHSIPIPVFGPNNEFNWRW